MDCETEINSLFDGELVCCQHREGYRFSIDAVLLAHFISVKKNDRVLDLGTGSGIISLILLYRYKDIISECSGVEIQQSLFDLATNNIEINHFEDKNKIFHCDIKSLKNYCLPEVYDKIICNPPFYPQHTGRISTNIEASVARHQTTAGVGDFLEGAAYAVKNHGSAYFIYPAELLADFLTRSSQFKLEAKQLRFIYSYPGAEKDAQLVLIKCTKNGGKGLSVSDPLYIYTKKNGSHPAEVESYYKKNRS
ncbi:MAG: tRNA1Val (adenine37-N6)-methyltransferase [Desulforhopalus sp.]|jgi:tRNA1Val (adenine37-N6)-methyltransferase